MSRRPDFLVIGAGRCGTTALHRTLSQHPDIFIPEEKSPNFFASADRQPDWEGPNSRLMATHWVNSLQAYLALFENKDRYRVVGEVSPVYLQTVHAPGRIASTCPGVKLIAILRDPIERAHSHYWGRRRDGLEARASFEEAVEVELERGLQQEVAFGCYLSCGLYYHFLRGYFGCFPEDRIQVLFHEDWVVDPQDTLRRILEFLQVDAGPKLVPKRLAQTGEITNPVLRALWTGSVSARTRLRPYLPVSVRDAVNPIFFKRMKKPGLATGTRSRLLPYFRNDVLKLQELTGKDLGRWLR